MSSSSKLSLKLLIHKPSRKVIFGEAEKKFIDFLFTILALPVGTIYNLVSTETTVGPLINLYHSVQNLSPNYFDENMIVNKNSLVNPKVEIPPLHIPSIFHNLPIQSPPERKLYKCDSTCCYYAAIPDLPCVGCKRDMDKPMEHVLLSYISEVRAIQESKGFVKNMTTFIVMDDLTVKPMSAISSISMLAEFGVDDVTLVEEKVVYLESKEALDLLRASLSSSTVLSDVFLPYIHFEEDSNSSVEHQNESSIIS